MLEWCMEHYILTFIIVLGILEVLNNVIRVVNNALRVKCVSILKEKYTAEEVKRFFNDEKTVSK